MPEVKRKVVFAANVDMSFANTEQYQRWQQWRSSPSIVVFLPPDERGALAAGHHAQLLMKRLDMAGVDLLTKWAPLDLDSHEALLFVAMFDKAIGLVTTSEWVMS